LLCMVGLPVRLLLSVQNAPAVWPRMLNVPARANNKCLRGGAPHALDHP
jgi:hypothetical protein